MISIIVPVYNCEEYLNECIDSILNQTYKDFELILVNDGSTDSSGLICDRYAEQDDRIRVIHKENGGQASARNRGIDAAKGEFFAFVDSDDMVHREYIERMLQLSDMYQADIVCCDYNKGECVDWSEYPQEIIVRDGSEIIDKMYINDGKLAIVCNKLFDKHFFKEDSLRFKEGHFFEDVEIAPRIMFAAKRMVISNDNLYFYRMRKGSTTHTKKFDHKRLDIMLAVESRLDFFKKHEKEHLYYIDLEGYIRKLIRYRAKMDKYRYDNTRDINEIEEKLVNVLRDYLFDRKLPIKIKVKGLIEVFNRRNVAKLLLKNSRNNKE